MQQIDFKLKSNGINILYAGPTKELRIYCSLLFESSFFVKMKAQLWHFDPAITAIIKGTN